MKSPFSYGFPMVFDDWESSIPMGHPLLFFGALTWFAPRNADLALLEDWRLFDDC